MKTKTEARQKAQDIVDNWTAGAFLTGWIPGSAIFLTAADAMMIRRVADTFGVGVFDLDAVKAHLGGVLASAVAGGVVSELVGLIPVAGWFVKSCAMAGKAGVIGDAVMDYFEERSPLSA